MNELRLNQNHDIELSGTRIARIVKDDADAYRKEAEQQCLCLLKCEERESFVDYTHGVPWFHRIFGLPVQYLDVATAIIRQKLSVLPRLVKSPYKTEISELALRSFPMSSTNASLFILTPLRTCN